ncbi:MAG: hypothetical protein KBS60_04150 [Phascolarctobacterium sp.]|nr:hypothetical protein [Candidatus Phascolarctobacterium caballi]
MAKVLIETLNSYAKLYMTGNTNVLAAMGRIIERLEQMGYSIDVKNGKYIIK